MKLFCCFTPAHEILFRDYFRPTIPAGFTVETTRLEIEGAGDFLSAEFLRCIGRKMELVLASIRENWGKTIIWSDVDIQFFDLEVDSLLAQLGENEIAFQRENPRMTDVNTGFFICRCNERVLHFFEQVRDGLQQNPQTNEQSVINDLLPNAALRWTYLPSSYYARTHGWPPPCELTLYHANWTKGKNGVEQKIGQFRELRFLRRFGWVALLITSAKYAPRRLSRLLGEFTNR